MATTRTHDPETIRDSGAGTSLAGGLGDIAVRRDALQARARAEAFLLAIRAVRHGVTTARAHWRSD